MLCRSLRSLSAGRLALAGLLCLALVGGVAAPARYSFASDEATSISLRAPEVPLAALETTSAVRFEKQGQAVRLTFHKPERSAHLSPSERPCSLLSRSKALQTSPLLPRRFLRPRHVAPRAPKATGDPFLASLSLS